MIITFNISCKKNYYKPLYNGIEKSYALFSCFQKKPTFEFAYPTTLQYIKKLKKKIYLKISTSLFLRKKIGEIYNFKFLDYNFLLFKMMLTNYSHN